ncbi:hypothetical protein Vretimale_15613 [Volvox reticuliferus]|uniref:Uncharacterized protein n=1 Tax=Volvox reticuliferus TaxID=1737510 RepID=A0A8J4GRM1_9CHLO|nr:hypothetical protein Vretifemale_15029 [Volvox reticuliferus]GIM12217.1 hypothetical protein Vretimale_15613 [Volvox reticuliferus]
MLIAVSALVVTVLVALPLLAEGSEISPMYRVHAFYYLWYTEPSEGGWTHWDHEVLSHWDAKIAGKFPHGMRFEPPDCLHSPYYPLRGPYSSIGRELIRQHLKEMELYGVGVLVASWWGPSWRKGSHDTQLVNTDKRLEQVIREIEETGSPVRVAFHLEPYEGRNKENVYEDLAYLTEKYMGSQALLRVNGRPVYYVYDSYKLPPGDWAQLLLRNDGPWNVRGTPKDGLFLGLWLDKDDGEQHILPAGFDGFYTYFSSDQVSYGSRVENWPLMQMWAVRKNKLFVPSVGPGYNDAKIRPWNKVSQRTRGDGGSYRKYWAAALGVGAQAVSVTSYNEWGEGTQIEPAIPREPRNGCQYLSYKPSSPYLYMEITRNSSRELGQLIASGNKGICKMGVGGDDSNARGTESSEGANSVPDT